MRAASLIHVAIAAVGMASWPARGAAGQELAIGSRSPRFLYAASTAAPPIVVDADRTPTLQRIVSLRVERPTVGRLLASIARQTGLRFAYGNDLSTARKVTLRADSITVASALAAILVDADVDVVFSPGGHAALMRRPSAGPVQEGSIVGRVTDRRSDVPLPGTAIEVQGTGLSGITGDDGRYHIRSVPSGTYTVRARYIGYVPVTASVTVEPDQEVTADFALEKSAQKLDELVTVTPGGMQTEVRGLPSPVSVITADEIEAQAPRNIQEVLRQAVPGAVGWDVTAAPSSAKISMRGSATLDAGNSTQTKVFVDGVQLAYADYVNLVDPQSIDRIEVLRGPQASAVYGSDAIGGVIQVFTKRGEAGTPSVQGEVKYGAVETPYANPQGGVRQHYSASMRGGTADATYNVGASYWRLGDWLPPASELSAQSSPNVFGGIKYTRGILTLDVSGRYGVVKAGGARNPVLLESGFVPFSRPHLNVSTATSSSLGAQLTVTPLPWWSSTLRVGIDNLTNATDQRQPRFTTPEDSLLQYFSFETSRRWIGYASVFQFQQPDLSGTVTAGFDHNNQPTQGVSSSQAVPGSPTLPSPFAYRLSTNNTGYFVQGQAGFRNALFLTAGVRAEQNTNFDDSLGTPLMPRVGASYVADFGGVTAKVRGSWGRAIRAPDPALKLALGPTVIPNPLLAPERQQGWDAGIDMEFGSRWSLGLTYFRQVAEDLIQFVDLPPQPDPLSQYQNIGRVSNFGVEVEVSGRSDWLEARASYAYTRSRIDDLGDSYTGEFAVGDQVQATPKHSSGLLLSATPRTGTTVSLGGAYVGSYRGFDNVALFRCLGGTAPCPPDFRFGVDYPDFVKLNLGVTQRIGGGFSALLQVDNVSNTGVSELANFFPVMGRITTVGLRFGN